MTTTAFFTPDLESLGQAVDVITESIEINQIWSEKHKKVCNGWIKQNNYKNVCLQFPDEYLPHSSNICDDLKAACNSKYFILADTSYGSCCVDEIAASHVNADCLIHFGVACRSKVSRLPVLYMFPEIPFQLDDFMNHLNELIAKKPNDSYCIYLDIGYHYVLDEDDEYFYGKINENVRDNKIRVEKYPFDEDHKINELANEDNAVSIFIGEDNERFFNLAATTNASKWFVYDPKMNTLNEKNPLVANWIRRRYFYIEKCKDAQTLGLIVATLTSDGYLDVVDHIQAMARSRGIKTQIISVGRINPAKLANFLEIDCFVLIGCPFNNLYNSREFYKPIVSVFEAEIAFNPAWYMKYPETYVMDFKDILPFGKYFFEFNANNIKENDVSLVSGKVRNQGDGAEDPEIANVYENDDCKAVQLKNNSIMEKSTGLTFEDRTWKGLDPALGLTEPALIQNGLSGIPTNYNHN